MVKNKLEKFFSESYKIDPRIIWGMKLHNNPMAHQTTPADYMLHYVHPVANLVSVLVECKQVTLQEGKGRLQIKRLKQMGDLLRYANIIFGSHKSFLALAYKEQFWRDSDVYLIPIQFLEKVLSTWNKESINRDDARELFKNFGCAIDKTISMHRIYDD